jgi:hypothetical protein
MIALLFAGCMSPVVGAECRPGLVECDGRCVDLASDLESCGACGAACASGEACIEAACTTPGGDAAMLEQDAGVPVLPEPDGGLAVVPSRPLPHVRPAPWMPAVDPALPRACDLGELACNGGCVRADRDPSHCGACGRACGAGELCVAGSCASSCPAPLLSCGALCVDTDDDPDHCGGCGVRCDTGLCIDGACELAPAGHLVLVGHDYTARRAAMSRIVGNAALLPSRRTVRVLGFEGAATSESRDGTIASIDATARDSGRAWVYEEADAERVSYRLAFADVLVVHAQAELGLDDAQRIGREWAVALASFLERGGTAVALVSSSPRDGTLAILESAGQLTLAGAPTEITGAVLTVIRSADAVAVGVPLSYRAERSTVRLPLAMDGAVVTDGAGPVVVHRAITP